MVSPSGSQTPCSDYPTVLKMPLVFNEVKPLTEESEDCHSQQDHDPESVKESVKQFSKVSSSTLKQTVRHDSLNKIYKGSDSKIFVARKDSELNQSKVQAPKTALPKTLSSSKFRPSSIALSALEQPEVIHSDEKIKPHTSDAIQAAKLSKSKPIQDEPLTQQKPSLDHSVDQIEVQSKVSE